MRFKKGFLALSLGLLFINLGCTDNESADNNGAESIYINGKIYTAKDKDSLQQAIAVAHDGTIIKVGSNEEIKKIADSNTQVIDLDHKVLMPGLIDSHIHALASGVEAILATIDSSDPTIDISKVEAKLKQSSLDGTGVAGDVLFLNGLSSEYWELADQLSNVFNNNEWKDHPIALVGSDHHTAWANQALLKKAGIDANFIQQLSPDDQQNIAHNDKFEPTGFVVDSGWDMVSDKIPSISHELLYKGSKEAIKYYNSLGLTAWMDIAANASPNKGITNIHNTEQTLGMIPMYKELSQKGELTARVSGLHVINSKSTPQVFNIIESINSKYKNIDNFKLIGVKVFADGVLEYPAQSAALLGRYSNSNKQGTLLFDSTTFKVLVNEADKRNMLVHIHAVGDRAVHESLNAFEYARSKRQSKVPHSITHLQLVDPNDYKRFKQNNVIASMQLAWAYEDGFNKELVKPYIDATSYKGMYPAHSLLVNGATIAGASDAPVSTANPFVAMATAITRKGSEGEVLNPAEAIDRDTVFKAYTINSAKALSLDKSIGTLEPGKKADMIVVDRDIFNVSPEQLAETKVVSTIFHGKKVYQQ
ncbi:amidohydrolase [Acinetobacter pittii]|uniref:Amidohydrolase n=1 Tax=Acinetobacter pittii TaxID=48296 RepID=A0A6H0FUB2_ACIPI|nr:amidohydrolase [Acinetobacter pittii]QIT17920.1 amidohydrolase [Acinetobacter pittii]